MNIIELGDTSGSLQLLRLQEKDLNNKTTDLLHSDGHVVPKTFLFEQN